MIKKILLANVVTTNPVAKKSYDEAVDRLKSEINEFSATYGINLSIEEEKTKESYSKNVKGHRRHLYVVVPEEEYPMLLLILPRKLTVATSLTYDLDTGKNMFLFRS
jgi:hypothetical protein